MYVGSEAEGHIKQQVQLEHVQHVVKRTRCVDFVSGRFYLIYTPQNRNQHDLK
jgi:hypothetical protein